MSQPKPKKKKHVLLTLLVLATLAAGEIAVSNNLLQITRRTLSYRNLPAAFDGFKIVHLTDLHGMSFGTNNNLLAKAILKQSPDIVVLTGDMAESDDGLTVLLALCRQLEGVPVYFIPGNHEQSRGTTFRSKMNQSLTEAGVVVLDNEYVTLRREDASIDLWGIETPLKYYRRFVSGDSRDVDFTRETLELTAGPAREEFTLLLAHNPVYFDTYVQWGADLTLCGHFHGGLVRIPFIGGLLSPEVEFFPHYDGGLYDQAEHFMFVSRGLGSGVVGFRVFNRPEVAVITLKSTASQN